LLKPDEEDHRLAGVIEKFNRSKEQFDIFRAELDRFVNADPKPYTSVGKFDHDAWEWVERFHVRQDFPIRLGVLLGDCVHNLRSALDHLACQVTLLDLPADADPDGVCDDTQFPIASCSERQFERMAKRRIPLFSSKHKALVKRLQPYHAGDEAERHPLSVLADLSNADKHRLVNPTYGFMASDTEEALERLLREGPEGPTPVSGFWIIGRGQRLDHDTPWFKIRFRRDSPAPTKVKVGGDPTVGHSARRGRVGCNGLQVAR
jgi:hypothetical protein